MCLKEIKETRINLKIIMRKPVLVHEKVDIAFAEVNQLMAIFLKSIETAQQNDERRRKWNSWATYSCFIFDFLFLIMAIISLIVAASSNNAIGRNNQLLWHLPIDLKFFKNTTCAMPVIMGRKTFESVGGKPLTGLTNIILSRKSD